MHLSIGFITAWQIDRLLRASTFGAEIGDFLPELLHFDPVRSILIVSYLSDYQDLCRFYDRQQQFPPQVAREIGRLLATIHGQTFENTACREAIAARIAPSSFTPTKILRRLSRITPRIFGMMPQECLQFYRLYQRFPSLTQAIADLNRRSLPVA